MKKQNINIKKLADDNHVPVTNLSPASLTAVADSARDLTNKEFKAFVRLVRLARRLDRIMNKWSNLALAIHEARSLSNREWRACSKLAKTLRKADAELAESEKIEQVAKRERFEKAQQGV